MHISNARSIPGTQADHGEIVHEMIGSAAGGTDTYSLAQIVLPPGKASLKHYHPVAEESYYILSGTGQIKVDEHTATLRPGDAIAILPEQVHQIFNADDENLVFLAICVPAWEASNSVYVD
ncbi:MAG TPA: cupin domain-containing protein [Aggregatilinea sp.]|jgi:mannose-6-phosphate isomerase-like protein (cupin superfamily)|uniref:cupin domain-containing protein n=1 Tax=Aggregatilinea sp. TaxID=2806333 RepID=UPI002C9E94A0|nr:cupin domain-containing protein [Aggregatilinea sp.]HML24690.1 cupin domain-containing protein [Aggregatilinea sp.]